jgi:hypothetical protein
MANKNRLTQAAAKIELQWESRSPPFTRLRRHVEAFKQQLQETTKRLKRDPR